MDRTDLMQRRHTISIARRAIVEWAVHRLSEQIRHVDDILLRRWLQRALRSCRRGCGVIRHAAEGEERVEEETDTEHETEKEDEHQTTRGKI